MAEPLTAEVTLEGITASVPAARHFVSTRLRTWQLGAMAETVELVTSELATNAVLHARSPFTVRLARQPTGAVFLEVLDGSIRAPQQKLFSATAMTGRGLWLVQRLSSAWGVDVVSGGKTVWVRFDEVTDRSGVSVA